VPLTVEVAAAAGAAAQAAGEGSRDVKGFREAQAAQQFPLVAVRAHPPPPF
jgi:hypothetical protein